MEEELGAGGDGEVGSPFAEEVTFVGVAGGLGLIRGALSIGGKSVVTVVPS